MNSSTSELELKIEYAPIGIGKLRIWRVVRQSMDSMKSLGKDLKFMTYCIQLSCIESRATANFHIR
jgi:hypothetical protein